MPIIDEQGRVFGRINAIDAAVAAVVIVLAPVAYAAYLLFRPAPVKIIGVEPARVPANQVTRVQVRGEHLRPYLRAQFGSEQVHSFLIDTPTVGQMEVPKMPPGSYDLTLFDEAEQIAELKGALTVLAPDATNPPLPVRVVGAFIDLDEAGAKGITAGARLGSPDNPVEVVSAGAPQPDSRRIVTGGPGNQFAQVPIPGRFQVPVVARVLCVLDQAENRCKYNGMFLIADQVFTLGKGLTFVAREVRANVDGQPADVVVQFVAPPEVVDLIKVGDRDLDQPGAARVTVTSVTRRESFQAQTASRFPVGGIERTITRNEPLGAVDATLHVLTDPAPDVTFNAAPLKVGDPFVLQTSRYAIRGTISRITAARTSDDKH